MFHSQCVYHHLEAMLNETNHSINDGNNSLAYAEKVRSLHPIFKYEIRNIHKMYHAIVHNETTIAFQRLVGHICEHVGYNYCLRELDNYRAYISRNARLYYFDVDFMIRREILNCVKHYTIEERELCEAIFKEFNDHMPFNHLVTRILDPKMSDKAKRAELLW